MEGISHEAASIAGHLGLGNIIYLYDDNHVTLDGPAPLSFSEDVNRRFEGYHWHTQAVEDGNDLAAIGKAIQTAIDVKDRPSIVRIRTIIGYGSPHRQGTSEAHGKALGPEEVKLTKQFYGWPLEPDFYVPDAALTEFRKAVDKGKQLEDDWSRRFDTYSKKNATEAKDFHQLLSGELPAGWDADLPTFTPKDNLATRKSASMVEQAILKKVLGTLRRRGGPERIDLHRYGGRQGIREGQLCRPQSEVRRARARDVRRAQWHRAQRRVHPIWVELFLLHRLRARFDSPRMFDEAARDLGFYARLDRPRRRRPDASADRASHCDSRDSQHHADSSRRCERGARGMARRDAA